MNPNQQYSCKINAETWRLLKQIAAHTGEKHYAVLTRLLAKEWQQLQAAATPKKGTTEC
jgi:hypothetical protein